MPLPDASDIASFGAPKRNYEIAPVDRETDLDAAEFNRLACDVAMASRMVDRVEVQMVGGTSPTVSRFEAVWKSKTITPPSVARTSAGVYTLTLPATVLDELSGAHVVNLTSAMGACAGVTAMHVQASASANVITVRTFDLAGVATDATDLALVVRAR